MPLQFHIDALRFKSKKYQWNSPEIQLYKVSFGRIRMLDTKDGKETIIIIPDGPNVIEHYHPIVKERIEIYLRQWL